MSRLELSFDGARGAFCDPIFSPSKTGLRGLVVRHHPRAASGRAITRSADEGVAQFLRYPDRWRESMTERRFVLVDFTYASDVAEHIRLYEAGNTYDMPRALPMLPPSTSWLP